MLFADVGNHDIHDATLSEAYIAMLDDMCSRTETEAVRTRLMYGSDWFVLALHPDAESFLETYERLFHERFGSEQVSAFLGGKALRLLGFDDPSNLNAQRLRRRYEAVAPLRLPAWLSVGEEHRNTCVARNAHEGSG
jgi:hypothetical protein